MSKLDTIQLQINNKVDPKKKPFWTIKIPVTTLKISKRTAQTWRDESKISFSQVETKYTTNYPMSEKLMQEHYNKSFKGR
jgi:hypothetical protein